MSTPTATPTITANVIGFAEVEFVMDERIVPLVVGFDPDGFHQTARALAERQKLDPAICAHNGATWSPCLDMRCPQCGSSMFLPPRLLAHRPAATIAAMDVLWCAAGWPEWRGDTWLSRWDIAEVEIFGHCGGIPVRHDRRQQFLAALLTLAVDGGA